MSTSLTHTRFKIVDHACGVLWYDNNTPCPPIKQTQNTKEGKQHGSYEWIHKSSIDKRLFLDLMGWPIMENGLVPSLKNGKRRPV